MGYWVGDYYMEDSLEAQPTEQTPTQTQPWQGSELYMPAPTPATTTAPGQSTWGSAVDWGAYTQPAGTNWAKPLNQGMMDVLSSFDPNWQQTISGMSVTPNDMWAQGAIGTSSHAQDMWGQLEQSLPGLAGTAAWEQAKSDWLTGSNDMSTLQDQQGMSGLPLPVMAVLAMMTGGAAGLLGAAGSPMAAGGLLGEVGSGLGGAVASAGGTALDAAALSAMGYNPANASLSGLTGVTSGATGGVTPPPEGYMSDLDLGGFGDMAPGPYDPALNAGTGAFDISGSAGTGLPGTGASTAGGSGSLTDLIRQIQSMTGNLPPGSTSALQKLLGGMMGGGTGGTGTGGTGGMDLMSWLTGTGTGTLGGLATGLMQYGEYGDQGDFLKDTMERAISASDPYGYGPYRKYAADQLQRTYTDPASIYNSPEMQALDQMFMDKTMAQQAQSGNLFNAPERVAQRQNNFYSNLNQYRQPLMQMSGSQFRPDTKAYYEFAGPIVQNALNESASLGGAINAGLGGLGGLLGGMGGTQPMGGATGSTGGLDLSGIWNLISGGGFGGGITGGVGDMTSFYDPADLLDLWL